jgi:hypothetical protein
MFTNPSPDMQLIMDKMASYVAKNGRDFEAIVRSKGIIIIIIIIIITIIIIIIIIARSEQTCCAVCSCYRCLPQTPRSAVPVFTARPHGGQPGCLSIM